MKHSLPILTLVFTVLAGCAGGDALDRIESRGTLKVVSRNGPTTFYTDKDGATGFEYALADLLARELGVELEMEPAFSLGGLFEQLRRDEADMAAAGLVLTARREASFPHSIAYARITPRVVYVAGTYRPRSIEDLLDMSTVVLSDSGHSELLRELQADGLAQLQWQEIAAADSMALLEILYEDEAELAIIGSNEFRLQQSLFPRLKVAFDLTVEQDLVWYLSPMADNTRLLGVINAFIERIQGDGTLEELREQYFGHMAGVSRISSHTFNVSMRRVLPSYLDLIKAVAAEYQLEWHLLAAIAYQESHWNPRATSPTGVRGMMMLTLPTAGELGVDNRLDPAQSLRGGARYLKNVRRRLPRDITEPDRTWLALAAYNVGLGHLEDARVLTERHGGDPDRWQDVMEHLPLLRKSKYYKQTRYGYARGDEAVTYVQNIRHYQSILEWQDIAENKPQPPLEIQQYLPPALADVVLQAL